jgi:ribosome-associated heat shock protein Hsp15
MRAPEDSAPDDADRRAAAARIRFDKWLWAARFYKTRALAAQAIETGRARLAGSRVKPAHVVRIGDAVWVNKGGLVWTVEITALDARRGSATVAAGLYRETPQSAAARAEEHARRRAAAVSAPRFPGRPTKRDRRKLADFLDEP